MTLIDQLAYFQKHRPEVDKYLQGRGISTFLASEFELGYCPVDCPSEFAQFRGRLTVPINNLAGDLVAFGGRVLDDSKPKWVNSSESDDYKKGRLLYNLNFAQDYILESGVCYVCEGYFDVISLWGAGIKNVVASCGTALTKHQVRLLKRFTDQIIVLYDADEAGEKAAERAVESLSDELIPLKSVTILENMDPDDFVRKYGADKLRMLAEG